jgi:hypothetical protein
MDEQVRRLHAIIDERIGLALGAPPVQLERGTVSSVVESLRIAMVTLGAGDTPVPITYATLPMDLVAGDEVVVLRRPDGWLLVVAVLGRDAPAGGGGGGGSHDDLTGVSPDDHHAQAHALVGGDHTASGLTAGHVVRASGATTFAWAQLGHGDLSGLTTGDPHTQYQQESEKAAANGYASLDASTRVPVAQLGSGTADQWTGLGGDGAWANRMRIWGNTADVSPTGTAAVDTGFSFTYTASDTVLFFELFFMHNRQAASGGLRFRWNNTTGNTGGNIRGILEQGATSITSWNDGTQTDTPSYDTWYGGAVPGANNAVRYGRWLGRLLLPTSGSFPGTIKLQVSSVAAAEARLVAGSVIRYAKF